MLKYERNKLVSIFQKDDNILEVHGVLDDDIYGLEMDVAIKIPELEIMAIDGKWNRWTTPECPRASGFLQEAVGFRIEEEGFSEKVRKTIGRKSCRHYANLLTECCYAAKEAAIIARWEEEKGANPALRFEDFLEGNMEAQTPSEPDRPVVAKRTPKPETPRLDGGAAPGAVTEREKMSGGMVIDLHVHTHPASPCSSAPIHEVIEEAKNIGLDGICLTDHNYVWDAGVVEGLQQRHGFLILKGNEITTDQGDMVVFGLERDVQGIIKLEDLGREVQEAGGFIIAVHPFRGFLTFGLGDLGLTPQKAMERPHFKHVDALEVLNGKVTEKENGFADEVAAGLGLPVTGGSDAHEVSEVGVYATRFSMAIKDEKGLIEALKSGNYTPAAFKKERREAGVGK